MFVVAGGDQVNVNRRVSDTKDTKRGALEVVHSEARTRTQKQTQSDQENTSCLPFLNGRLEIERENEREERRRKVETEAKFEVRITTKKAEKTNNKKKVECV
jgi:hypothetical protein